LRYLISLPSYRLSDKPKLASAFKRKLNHIQEAFGASFLFFIRPFRLYI
jgi:hypothetical protein